MLKSLALFWLGAATIPFDEVWKGGLRMRFDFTIFGIGKSAFISLPQSATAAEEQGWKRKKKIHLPKGYAKLSMYCPKDEYTVCLFFDDTGYIAGVQVAFREEDFHDNIFDWTIQGFSRWTITVGGKTVDLWTTRVYFISPETLAIDSKHRVAHRNPDLMLQDHSILVSGFNGKLYRISTNASEITGPNSDFTEQSCVPGMGEHYYYKMSKQTKCKASTLFPWSPAVASNQLVSIQLLRFGNYSVKEELFDAIEPARTALKAMIPEGPQCLYDLGHSPGLVSLHIYFIETPFLVSCLFE
ncbi:hypothetical protein PYW07_008070 [Mythimna separata]|uniref:Uncharacterized protein n=1 Tax=Mythimna separata TaxID=271217 RepID=A0AAD7YPK4_MYTSE|nr:hypothetical protein PYW07_008070 [Mythimna separata]